MIRRCPLIVAVALIDVWGSGFWEGLTQAQELTTATVLSIGDGETIRVLQGQQRITTRLACNRCAEA